MTENTMTLDRELLAAYLTEYSWFTEADNVREGIDLESYENELQLIGFMLRMLGRNKEHVADLSRSVSVSDERVEELGEFVAKHLGHKHYETYCDMRAALEADRAGRGVNLDSGNAIMEAWKGALDCAHELVVNAPDARYQTRALSVKAWVIRTRPSHVTCQYCDDTGDVHSIDGEWRGPCTACDAKEVLAQGNGGVRDGWKDMVRSVLSALDKATGDTDPNIDPDMTDDEVRDEYPEIWAMQQLSALLAASPQPGEEGG
jgi:hypothetical protein